MEPYLTLRIDLDSPVPAYRQIVDALRTHMVEGRLRPDDRLPSVRELAVDLTVHHNTVAQAYRELAAEGWLDLRRRRGAVVRARPGPAPAPATRERFDQRLRELVAKAQSDGVQPHALAEDLDRLLRQLKEEAS